MCSLCRDEQCVVVAISLAVAFAVSRVVDLSRPNHFQWTIIIGLGNSRMSSYVLEANTTANTVMPLDIGRNAAGRRNLTAGRNQTVDDKE